MDFTKQCYICHAAATAAVGVYVAGETAEGDFCIRISAPPSCREHEGDVGRRVVDESWEDLQGQLTVQVTPAIALEGREDWIISEVLKIGRHDGPSEAELRETFASDPSSVKMVEFVGTD